jgi:hypothetical protein
MGWKLKLNNKNRTFNNKKEKATKMKTIKILIKIKEWMSNWIMITKIRTIKKAKTIIKMIMTTKMENNRKTLVNNKEVMQTNKIKIKNKLKTIMIMITTMMKEEHNQARSEAKSIRKIRLHLMV